MILLVLLAFQPVTEIVNNLYYHRHPRVALTGVVHLWLGRGLLLAGIIQGGLGFAFAASFPNAVVDFWPRAVYGASAVVAYVTYLTFAIIRPEIRKGKSRGKKDKVEEGIFDGGSGNKVGDEMNVIGAGGGYGYGYGYGGEMTRY